MRKWMNLFEMRTFDPEWVDESMFGPAQTLTLYHASPHTIERFHPFTHMGTERAALDRADHMWKSWNKGFFLYECEVSIGRSVEGFDSGQGNHDVEGVMSALESELHLDFHEVEAVYRDAQASADLLAQYGIDAIHYTNRQEDAGSISYILLQPDRITIRNIDRL